MAGRTLTSKLIKSVFSEIERKGIADEYTEDKVLTLLKKFIYSNPKNRKTQELYKFISDARLSLQQLIQLLDSRNRNSQIRESLQNCLRSSKKEKLPSRPIRKVQKQGSYRDIVEEDSEIELSYNKDNISRCKSCCCSMCGGKHYYTKVQQKLFVLPSLNEFCSNDKVKKRSSQKFELLKRRMNNLLCVAEGMSTCFTSSHEKKEEKTRRKSTFSVFVEQNPKPKRHNVMDDSPKNRKHYEIKALIAAEIRKLVLKSFPQKKNSKCSKILPRKNITTISHHVIPTILMPSSQFPVLTSGQEVNRSSTQTQEKLKYFYGHLNESTATNPCEEKENNTVSSIELCPKQIRKRRKFHPFEEYTIPSHKHWLTNLDPLYPACPNAFKTMDTDSSVHSKKTTSSKTFYSRNPVPPKHPRPLKREPIPNIRRARRIYQTMN